MGRSHIRTRGVRQGVEGIGMSNYCFQCSMDMGFPPPGDFSHWGESGKLTPETTANNMGMLVLCEGCGCALVDHRGVCMGECDIASHGTPEGEERVQRALALLTRTRRFPWNLWFWWNGTPWNQGYRHYLRWRYYHYKNRLLGNEDFPF